MLVLFLCETLRSKLLTLPHTQQGPTGFRPTRTNWSFSSYHSNVEVMYTSYASPKTVKVVATQSTSNCLVEKAVHHSVE